VIAWNTCVGNPLPSVPHGHDVAISNLNINSDRLSGADQTRHQDGTGQLKDAVIAPAASRMRWTKAPTAGHCLYSLARREHGWPALVCLDPCSLPTPAPALFRIEPMPNGLFSGGVRECDHAEGPQIILMMALSCFVDADSQSPVAW